jgi:hypothetical protein
MDGGGATPLQPEAARSNARSAGQNKNADPLSGVAKTASGPYGDKKESDYEVTWVDWKLMEA